MAAPARSLLHRLTEAIPAQFRRYVVDAFRIDTRTLAVFRILLGWLIVADILLRSRNFGFMYTESGAVPQSLAEQYTPDTAFSVYYFTTDPTVIAALFVLTALVGIQLMIGYKTRIAIIASFLLVISLDHHNPLVLSFADTLFRMLLFWAIFLPLGERWSIDALHRDRTSRSSVASVPTALILIQVAFVYVSNAVAKSFSEVWRTGEAATLVLGLDNITFLFGESTRVVPELLQVGGLIWYLMLSFAWLLFFFRGRLRLLFTGMFITVHASFALTVRIGAFPYVSIAGVLLFVQGQFWRDGDRLLKQAGIDPTRAIPSQRRQQQLASLFPTLQFDNESLKQIRSVVYSGAVGLIVISILLVIAVLLMNLGAITEDPEQIDDRVDETLQETTGVQHVETVAVSLNIDQPGWSIFAPHPRTTDRYYVFAAETADGEYLDVYNDRELSYERHHDELQKQFGTYRERFYMNSIRRAGGWGDAPGHLADQLCAEYEEDRDTELIRINMYEVTEEVTVETIDSPEDRDREANLMSRHACGDHTEGTVKPPEF